MKKAAIFSINTIINQKYTNISSLLSGETDRMKKKALAKNPIKRRRLMNFREIISRLLDFDKIIKNNNMEIYFRLIEIL